MNYHGKVAFITGGASGIGLAIAEELARRGARLAIADIQADSLAAAEQLLASVAADVSTYRLDVTDRAAVLAVAEKVVGDFGKVDLVFNNAGIGDAGSPLDSITGEFFDWIMSVNVTGVMNVLQAFVPILKRQGAGGHIVNTSSMAGLVVMPGWNQGLYAATKMAVLALSLDLHYLLAGEQIGVSALCPGLVSTNILDNAAKLRPASVGGELPEFPEMLQGQGMAPAEVAQITLRGIDEKRPIIVTQPDLWPLVAGFHDTVRKAFETI
jgi:NAD(P)-dependent dehydrogenase (short-subunit alcohol dehydrogenase family)